jgi:hypothetical protein
LGFIKFIIVVVLLVVAANYFGHFLPKLGFLPVKQGKSAPLKAGTYTYDGGRFQVSLPPGLELQCRQRADTQGTVVKICAGKSPGTRFSAVTVSYAHPLEANQMDQQIDAGLKIAGEFMDASVTKSEKTRSFGVPGSSFVLKTLDGNAYGNLFAVPGYTVYSIGEALPGKPESEEIDSFIETLQPVDGRSKGGS